MSSRVPRHASRALRQVAHASRTPSITASRALSTSSTQYATAAVASSASSFNLPSSYVSPTKPPSARPAETRKSQLIRTYTSLLRSAPLVLFLQHNNLTAQEWASIRRELRAALAAVPVPAGQTVDIVPDVTLNVLRTRMFAVALKIVSFFDAKAASAKTPLVHDLSEAAYNAMKEVEIPENSSYAEVAPLLVGPTAALVFPAVSPAHLAAALKVLAPGPAGSPTAPPMRKKNPGYYEPACQNGLAKLLLVGGRVEGSVFDVDGVRWVGGIGGGMEGLRAQLIGMLQSAGLGLTSALESGGKSVWLALEGRKVQLEEEQDGGKKEEKAEESS
ncbi:hypothetical protein ACHAQA_007022 [Verticillium albo-atrum]